MALLSDSESDSGVPSFGVNKEFASKYETKKRTEELSKLQDKYGKDYTLSDEESDESFSDEDSDAEFVTPQVDVAILRTLARIRQKDPSVYEEGREVFDEEETRSGPVGSTSAGRKAKDSKPVLLKDYQRARLLADPTASQSDSVSADGFARTFAQESLELKDEVTRAFHAGASSDSGSDSDDDGLLVRREKTKDEREREDAEYELFLQRNAGPAVAEAALALEPEEKFLRDYILNRGWIDRAQDKARIPSYNEITGSSPELEPGKKSKSKKAAAKAKAASSGADAVLEPGLHDSEEDEFDEVADDFEHKYNFRFEEAGSSSITTHARNISSSVRKPATAQTARAKQREAAKQREEEQKQERREEIRRLKALKRKEVEDKLLKLVEAAGSGATNLDSIDLEGDWDPDEHDRKMALVYGDAYGDADDADFKPTWDDDIDIGDIPMSDDDDDAAGAEVEQAEEDEEEEEEEAASGKKSKREKSREKKKKQKAARDVEGFPTELLERAKEGADEARKELLDSILDDYYALDYEDKVGGVATRFKYAKVAPSSFELSAAEILLATDSELNSFMSLKKLAPYRQSDDKDKARKQKKRLKELRDAIKNRKWGEELDEDQAERDQKKKRKWSEATSKDNQPKEKKNLGKSERKKRKLEREAAAAAAASERQDA